MRALISKLVLSYRKIYKNVEVNKDVIEIDGVLTDFSNSI